MYHVDGFGATCFLTEIFFEAPGGAHANTEDQYTQVRTVTAAPLPGISTILVSGSFCLFYCLSRPKGTLVDHAVDAYGTLCIFMDVYVHLPCPSTEANRLGSNIAIAITRLLHTPTIDTQHSVAALLTALHRSRTILQYHSTLGILSTLGTNHQQAPCAPSSATTLGSTIHIPTPFCALKRPTNNGKRALPI